MRLNPEKTSGLSRIRIQDLCDTGTVFYQLSYQAHWELIMLLVRNIPVEGAEYKWTYEISYNWIADKDMRTCLIVAVMNTTQAAVKLKREKKFRLRGGFEPITSTIPVQCSTNWAMISSPLEADQVVINSQRDPLLVGLDSSGQLRVRTPLIAWIQFQALI